MFKLSDSLYKIKIKIKYLVGYQDPFLCIITPIFDPAFESFQNLVSDLQAQTFRNFIHISISNGPSPKIKSYIQKIRKSDKRFVCDELPYNNQYEKSKKYSDLLSEIGRRRNYTIKKYQALRYLFLGADFKLTDNDFFNKLHFAHFDSKKDIIIASVNAYGSIYPKLPLQFEHIDLSNYTFSKNIVNKFDYPSDYDEKFPANDWRFFDKIKTNNNIYIMDCIYGEKDGYRSYKSLGEIQLDELNNHKQV